MTDRVKEMRKKIEDFEVVKQINMHDWGDDWISATIVFEGD